MPLTETIKAQPPPIQEDAQGVVRVGGTRVTLETIVGAYLDGDSAEEIHSSYPSVTLADIHAVLSYYLQNRQVVNRYLEEAANHSAETREENEARWPAEPLRTRLLARLDREP